MRIGIIVPGGVDRSGRERVIPALLWLIERLAMRHMVHVFALGQYPEACSYELLGAMVHNLPTIAAPPGLGMWRLWRVLAVALRATGPFDILHGLWAGASGALAALAGRALGVPSVVSIGGGELVWLPRIGYGGQGNWRSRALTGLALRLAHSVTAGSRYALAPLMARRPDARWVPLGVATELFDAPVERPAAPPWRLLHVASINRVKDQPTLLRALRLVADCSPELRLDWVGEDTLGGALQALSQQLGLEKVVQFHAFQPSAAIVPLYRAAHLHLLSSLHESQCVAVCEAAAAGLPTVGTAVGLMPELAPEAAWAVPPGDADALAQGMLALLHDKERREQIGRAAQVWARAHNAEWTAGTFEGIYRHRF